MKTSLIACARCFCLLIVFSGLVANVPLYGIDKSNESILVLYMCPDGILHQYNALKQSDHLRGSAVYKINLFKHLVSLSFNVSMMIINDHDLYNQLIMQGYHVQELHIFKNSQGQKILADELYKLCSKQHYDIIHCHSAFEIGAAREVARKIPLSVVATMHLEALHNVAYLKGLDGVLCVSERTARFLAQENDKQHTDIKNIGFLAPFFNEECFAEYKPVYSREQFFKKQFDVTIQQVPMLCMVANFYKSFKDHTTVLYALKKLIFDDHIPVQVAFAGIGPRMNEMQQLAKKLNVDKNVYFLGHTEQIPELLYHSDIKVLSSTSEAFGIVLLEAAMLKKPLIGTRGTGMESVIIHGQTGLLFSAHNDRELADCIKQLLRDRAFAQQLGQQAYDYVQDRYTTRANIQKLASFYTAVAKSSVVRGGCFSSNIEL